MQTKKITSYRQFIALGRPYVPVLEFKQIIDPGVDGLIHNEGADEIFKYRLLLPNFATCPDNHTLKHKKRLAINSGVIYNRDGYCAVWCVSQSCLGMRYTWRYFYQFMRLRWFDLPPHYKRKIVTSWYNASETLPLLYSPVMNWQKWIIK